MSTEAEKRAKRKWALKHPNQSKEWAAKNPERARHNRREWIKRNPERRKATLNKWRRLHPDAVRSTALKMRYGITIAEYDRLLAEQGGHCKICPSGPQAKRLHVDHNHDTGAIRGLLCSYCNMIVGVLETPGLLESARNYLNDYLQKETANGIGG